MTRSITAAFRSPLTGAITTGITHADAFFAGWDCIESLTEEQFVLGEGFVVDGKFLSRDATAALCGIRRSEQLAHA